MAYGPLVPRPLLDALPFVNLHPSALPHWRGAAPIERALMAGERDSAVAAMLLVEALDAGPVAALERFDVGPDEDAGAVYDRALGLGLPPLARALADAAGAALATVPQVGEATYAAKIVAADRLLDPRAGRASCTTACGRSRRTSVRASSLDGAPFTIWRTRVHEPSSRPGRSRSTATPCCSAAATGALELCELQPPGGRRMPAADWLRGLRGALPAATSA